MPFDGSTCTLTQQNSLSRLLTELGIEPVSDAVLEQHKASEIAKYPASPMFNYPGFFQFASLLTSAMCMAAMMLTTMMWVKYSCGTAPLFSTICVSLAGILCFFGMFKFGLASSLKGPAQWIEERRSWTLHDVPKPIQTIARKIKHEDNHVEFVIGTLYQKTIALDPYLLAEVYDRHTGEINRACLGIWDGDKIIQLAHIR